MATLFTAFDHKTFTLVDPQSQADQTALNNCTVTTLALAQNLNPKFKELSGHADCELAKDGRRIMVALWKPEGVGMFVFPAHLERPSDTQLIRAFNRLVSAPDVGTRHVRCTWDEE